MPLKRPLSPVSLSPNKRRFITKWLGAADCPQDSIETTTTVWAPPASLCEDNDKDTVSTISRAISSTSATGYTENAFILALHERQIQAAELSEEPTNWDEIKKLFAAVRSTPEPSIEDYQSLELDIHAAGSEDDIRDVFSQYIKKSWKKHTTIELRSNYLWTNHVPLRCTGITRITKPKPDYTCGFRYAAFPKWYHHHRITASNQAIKSIQYHDEVNPGLMWPLVSIEIKGERGLLAEAILQNAHTGAVMVSNLLELKRRAGVDIPYGHTDVFTISMDKFSLLISAHWAVLNDLGETEYMHKTVRRWFVRDADLGIFTEARRAVRNSIETHLDAMRSVIISDLERVRERDLQAEAERQAETEAEKETSLTPAVGEFTATTEKETPPTSAADSTQGRVARRKATVSMDLSSAQARSKIAALGTWHDGSGRPADRDDVDTEDELG